MEITRSFSKTIQLKDFHPISAFCSLKAEVDEKDIEKRSAELYKKCVKIVEADVLSSYVEYQNKVQKAREKATPVKK